MRFSGKVAAITGGASGIGLACAEALIDEGAHVILFDVNETNLTEVTAKLGSKARGQVLDVGDPEAVTAAFDQIEQTEGRLDILVASAAIPLVKPIIEIEAADWQRVIGTNLSGLFYCSQAAARIMVAQGDGRIVHMSSVNGIRAISGRGAYSVAKGGVEMLTKMMAAELGETGVTVNSVAPAPVDTPMIKQMHDADTRAQWHGVLPIKRYATPAEVASATLFLLSDDARYITGHTLPVDGGFSAAGLLMGK